MRKPQIALMIFENFIVVKLCEEAEASVARVGNRDETCKGSEKDYFFRLLIQ
jgi:hypothetical protein